MRWFPVSITRSQAHLVLVKTSDNPAGTLRLRFEPVFSYSLEIKNTTMASAEASFDLLSQEIKLDLSLSPENRNHKFANSTLALFKQHNLGQVEHDLWRESLMLEEMQAILDQRFGALNPHLTRLANMPISSFKSAFKYEQEVDAAGQTEFWRDAATRTRYPNLDRESLELLAADNYIFKKQGIRPASAELNAEADQNECKKKEINTNPILSWRELVEELEPHHISADALNKAVAASVKKNYGKNKRPWPMASCGKGYLIVEIGENFKDGKNHPTPAVCKYQKDIQDPII